jgi:ribosomal-protein-alanine N-acetyltransferase
MSLKFELLSDRLRIAPLQISDAAFILRLVNTEGWLKYIGNRNTTSIIEAEQYIQRMNGTDDCQTWSVTFVENEVPIGIITYIKRDYLDSHDLGFAFLPEFQNRGFAFEAANTVITRLKQFLDFKCLYAITIPDNSNSIRLLENLGFEFEKRIDVENEELLLFKI